MVKFKSLDSNMEIVYIPKKLVDVLNEKVKYTLFLI